MLGEWAVRGSSSHGTPKMSGKQAHTVRSLSPTAFWSDKKPSILSQLRAVKLAWTGDAVR